MRHGQLHKRARAQGLGEAGTALAEMAIMLPFFMIIMLGVIDFCRVFYSAVAVTQAARAGVQYGARNASKAQAVLYTGMTTAATNVTTDYRLTGPTPAIVPQRYCVCAGTPPTCPASGSNACPPAGGTCDTNYQIYVCTSATYAFSTFAPYPGIPSTVNLVRTATMRVQ